MNQKTLKTPVSCKGVGVHSASPITLEILPAEPHTGIVFERSDLPADMNKIPANWSFVTDTKMCTKIDNGRGASVSTVEHVMAGLAACEIDNCIIRVSGPEVPIMDGSAAPFIFLVECAGITEQEAPRQYVRVTKPVKVEVGENRWATLKPSEDGRLSIDFFCDFAGRENFEPQRAQFNGEMNQFKVEYSTARTFGFVSDLRKLQELGLAKASSLENSVGLENGTFLTKNGLRFTDECVRHKVLDCLGDMYMGGMPIIGQIETHNGGHHLNYLLLKALLCDKEAYEIVQVQEVESGGTMICPAESVTSESRVLRSN